MPDLIVRIHIPEDIDCDFDVIRGAITEAIDPRGDRIDIDSYLQVPCVINGRFEGFRDAGATTPVTPATAAPLPSASLPAPQTPAPPSRSDSDAPSRG